MNRGREIHGEVSSADAHAGVAIQLYEAGGGTITLGSTELPAISDFSVISAAGGDVSIKSINATGTLTLFRGTVVANGGEARCLNTPFFGRRGGTLILTAPAGQVDVQLEGVLLH
jgi:hypothetical protein